MVNMAKKQQNLTVEDRVLNYIRQHELVRPGMKVLVAVSGGPDSVCLLHTLHELQSKLKIRLHTAHLNHGLRGDEAAADASYVEKLAAKLDIPATIEARDVAGYQKKHHLTLEEAAREVRYAFLAETAQKVEAGCIAVGHTLNDQVETILLHVIRGAGTRGLRGLQPSQKLRINNHSLIIIRPLLEVRREETEACCSQNQLAPCVDASNASMSLLRNRVRHELLPLLQKYNPGISESLLRLGRIAEDDLAFLEAEALQTRPQVMTRKENTIIFVKDRFINLAPALQRYLLRQAIEDLIGTLKDIETRHIEEVLEALAKPAGRRVVLPEGLVFSIEYDRYLLGRHPEELAPFPELKGEYEIKIPGKTMIPGWTIETSLNPRESFTPGEDSFTACFDKDKINDKMKVRARQKGDSFQPLGMDGIKKVGEFMLDARIPRAWRDRIPILYTPRQVVWVAGWRLDDRVKVTEETSTVLRIKIKRASGRRGSGKSGTGPANRRKPAA